MKLFAKSVFILLTTLAFNSCNSKHYSDIAITDQNADNIISIAKELSVAGPRNAGTGKEGETREFILSRLKSYGVDADVENFDFESYRLKEMTILIDGSSYQPTFAGINPYEGSMPINAETYIADESRPGNGSPEGKILISDNPDMFFMALQSGSRAFVSLDKDDFEAIKTKNNAPAVLMYKGTGIRLSSANIIVNLGRHDKSLQTLCFTAHYDSYLTSPGANDNGTGVGALLEMARVFKSVENSLPMNVRLVFFGSEEIGLVGSREYVSTHLDELGDIRLLINFDTFGGNRAPYIATARGQQGIPAEGIANQLDPVMNNRALEGPAGKWRLFHPSIFPMVMASNYPEWVQAVVDSAASDLKTEVYNQHLMSDHLTFAGAGVPAISIQSREHTIHSEADIPENINRESVRSCFALAWQITKRILENN